MVLTFAGLARSQGEPGSVIPKTTGAKVSQRSPDIDNLLTLARTTSPEFAIDALLRIAASSQVDAMWKQEILEEAFLLTAKVQNSFRLRAAPLPGTSSDTRPSYLSNAFDQQLDALSLRSRIVDQMSSINKSRALGMLSEIPSQLRFREISCSDWMSYDVSSFYRTVKAISETAFDRKRIQQGERVQFLLPYVEGMTSPVQVGPIARLLVEVKLSSREVSILSQAFVSALRKVNGDDRSFSPSLNQDRIVRDFVNLVELLKKERLGPSELLTAVHDYLGRHLKGVRCQDSTSPIDRDLPMVIKEANYLFPNAPFEAADVKPAKIEPSRGWKPISNRKSQPNCCGLYRNFTMTTTISKSMGKHELRPSGNNGLLTICRLLRIGTVKMKVST
jgi:hypothetical protein